MTIHVQNAHLNFRPALKSQHCAHYNRDITVII